MPKSDPKHSKAGPPERSETLDAGEDVRRIAYHEAGHVYAAWFGGGQVVVHHVSIIADDADGSLGRTLIQRARLRAFRYNELTAAGEQRCDRVIVGLLAGEIAETHYCGPSTPLSFGWTTDDRQRVFDVAEIRTGDTQELEAYVTWLRIRTEGLVASWEAEVAIPALANTLLARRELTGAEALAVMQEAIQSAITARTP